MEQQTTIWSEQPAPEPPTLYVVDDGAYTEASRAIIMETAKQIYETNLRLAPIHDPAQTIDFFKQKYALLEREIFATLWLDDNRNIIAEEQLFFGTINQAAVYPREVARRGLELNATSVILCHNHPSGDSTPSNADKQITNKLIDVLNMIKIEVLDHIVVGRNATSVKKHFNLNHELEI